jgi:hypothetical protein
MHNTLNNATVDNAATPPELVVWDTATSALHLRAQLGSDTIALACVETPSLLHYLVVLSSLGRLSLYTLGQTEETLQPTLSEAFGLAIPRVVPPANGFARGSLVVEPNMHRLVTVVDEIVTVWKVSDTGERLYIFTLSIFHSSRIHLEAVTLIGDMEYEKQIHPMLPNFAPGADRLVLLWQGLKSMCVYLNSTCHRVP